MHVSEFLALPSAFGAIQLGETFSWCFSVNNETHTAVQGIHIRTRDANGAFQVTPVRALRSGMYSGGVEHVEHGAPRGIDMRWRVQSRISFRLSILMYRGRWRAELAEPGENLPSFWYILVHLSFFSFSFWVRVC